jgi:hypothetical protein
MRKVMANQKIDFQLALKKIVVPRIGSLGYQKITLPKLRGSGITFFQKHLFGDVYGYLQFQLGNWVPTPYPMTPMPRSFRIFLVRNIGSEPITIPSDDDHYYLNQGLSRLLWVILGIFKYEWEYHEWKYFTVDELETQLQIATEDLILYGIPWLEDLNSKNPY